MSARGSRRFFKFLAAIAGTLFLCLVSIWSIRPNAEALSVFQSALPSSLDPLEYLTSNNQPIQNIVGIRLFTYYSDSLIRPQLADSWALSESKLELRIKIRSDVHFSDGRLVSSKDVARSLKRTVLALLKQNSKNAFANSLAGVEHLKTSLEVQSWKNIYANGDAVIIEFRKAFPEALESLSSGLFSVFPEDAVDDLTGIWKSRINESYAGAGPYKITKLLPDGILFELRDDYPAVLVHPHAFKKIRIGIDRSKLATFDLVSAADDIKELLKSHSFSAGGKTGTLYFQCHTWKSKKSPLSNHLVRVSLRNKLYSILQSKNFEFTRSILPTSMPNVVEPVGTKNDASKLVRLNGNKITFSDGRPFRSIRAQIVTDALEQAILALGGIPIAKPGIPYANILKQLDPNLSNYDVDISLGGTNVEFKDPIADVRQMFSREGLWIPDVTGAIEKSLAKTEFSIQEVNQEVYSQSAVIPLARTASGFWLKNRVDLSRYNKLLPLGELQWIGSR